MKMKHTYTYDDIQIVPTYSEIESRSECNLKTRLTNNIELDLPYISSPMDTVTGAVMMAKMSDLGGIGIMHRFNSINEQLEEINGALHLSRSPFLFGAAVGASGDYQERVQALVEQNIIRVILIDVAHGNTIQVKNALSWIKSRYSIDVIAGNIATTRGAMNLVEWGADAIRVGIGGGSVCETRIRTGIGIPQVTALIESLEGVEKMGSSVPIIADGGIKTPGDVAKALSLGADTVMLGSLFAGTRETPGDIEKIGQWPNEQLVKKYRGAASLDMKKSHGMESKNVEGNSKTIPYKGKVERIINDISDGVKSSMSYVGAKNLTEFRNNSEHVIITQNELIEAKPHLLL